MGVDFDALQLLRDCRTSPLAPTIRLHLGTIILVVPVYRGPSRYNEVRMSATLRWMTPGCTLALALVVAPVADAQDVTASGYGHPDTFRPRFDESYAGPYVVAASRTGLLLPIPRPTELVPSAWGYGTYDVPTATGIRPAPVGTPTLYVIETPTEARRKARSQGPRILSRGRRNPVSTSINPPMQAGARIVTVAIGRHASR